MNKKEKEELALALEQLGDKIKLLIKKLRK